jgi:Dyp-type peroxidase family
VHAVLLLYATDDGRVAAEIGGRCRTLEEEHGATVVRVLRTHLNVDRFGVKEQFGFRDGIGQPAIEGTRAATNPDDTVAAGEFILGYRNQYRQFPSTPVVPTDPTRLLPVLEGDDAGYDLGRNGTYLVFRQLEQDVRKFWTVMRERAGSDAGMVWLASKMIGRWPSGAPLVTSPDRDLPGLENHDAFQYAGDPHGFACPLGAHARRANPRDALPNTAPGAQSLGITKRHRIIRRGRHYGPPLDPTLDPVRMLHAPHDHIPRGLHFIALNADLTRQFEFMQHTWLNDPKFGALYAGPDPLFGDRVGPFRDFVVQRDPVRRQYRGLSPFVTVRGGAYFFLPGVQALRYLARIPAS